MRRGQVGAKLALDLRLGAGDLALEQRQAGDILRFAGEVVTAGAPLGKILQQLSVGIGTDRDRREGDITRARLLDQRAVWATRGRERAPIGEQHRMAHLAGLARQFIQPDVERAVDIGAAPVADRADPLLDLRQAQAGTQGLELYRPLLPGIKRQHADAILVAQRLGRQDRRFLGHIEFGDPAHGNHAGGVIDDQQERHVGPLRPGRRGHRHR